MPLLSIIIPVYNVERYLADCLDSILNQNFTDFEVILVNDASSDNSGEICDEYVSRHNNFKVIHLPKNMLPAGARNVGLEHSSGDYVHFCDSDDYYIKNSFLNIVDALQAHKPDVLIGQFICKPEKGAFYCSDVSFDPAVFQHDKPEIVINYLNKLPKLTCTTWRFILKREFLLKNQIYFLEGFHVEDEEWFPKIICSAEKIALLSSPFYCYRPRATGSITSSKTYLHTKAHFVIALQLLSFLFEKGFSGARKDFIMSRVKFLIGLFSTRCDTLEDSEIHELSRIYEDYRGITLRRNLDIGLFQLLDKYGGKEGLTNYRTSVIEETLKCVEGNNDKDIYIFPTGYNGEASARILKSAGFKVVNFLDNSENKRNCIIEGIPVNSPDILKNFTTSQFNQAFIVVSIQQKQIARIIQDQLRGYGLKDHQFTERFY
ncbi:glycosyltransferase family 2 protein [Alkaliphilus pronyensis]|uniref:Glycosyltransferase family 2 protein n=1 Tax=Alkaliphilus pronyensis TaxID=1482732 RepID=A0A6I0FBN7_9FIRM|nr:glycosyltransferase family 2 protein [Alkaliphilus pronyensis]KAB3539665.1 glycosyltransferase family 2 protein [Alkaliphilus pronyensis]